MDAFSLHGLTIPLQILLIDLMLGADNALLIGLASQSLPAQDRKLAASLGIGGAVALRLIMTLLATTLLALPLVKLIGAVVLTIIALNLAGDDALGAEALETTGGRSSRLWAAAATIVVADAVMSIDNVVALAAIAQGNFVWLLIGVGLSLPMLGYGGLVAAEALHKVPGLVTFGAAMLGWISGGMAVSDGLWAHWIDANAPGLAALAPALGAAFVYLHGLLIPRPMRAPIKPLARPRRAAMAQPVSPPPRALPPPPVEPAGAARTEDRAMVIGLLLLALVAGGFIVLIAIYGGVE